MPAECCKKFWERIPEDVPVFTLVGWDRLAERTVRFWVSEASMAGVPAAKMQKGINHILWMQEYAEAHPEMMKLPD
jgi:N-glycosylase/DNA lyase